VPLFGLEGTVMVCEAAPPLDQFANCQVRPLESTCVRGALRVCVVPCAQMKL